MLVWYSEEFLQRGAQVTAIDVSQHMIEAAKRRIGNQAQVQCVDLSQPLPFPDQYFVRIIVLLLYTIFRIGFLRFVNSTKS